MEEVGMLVNKQKEVVCHEHCYDEESRKEELAVNMNYVILNESHSMDTVYLVELKVLVEEEIVKTEKEKLIYHL